MKVLDLCAGTGSATRAFVNRGYDVDTLDVVGGHTFNMDVRKFRPWKKYDFIWASPPCQQFSKMKMIKCKDRNPDLSIVYACMEICKTAPYWILENPQGCLRHFIGMPQVTVKYGDYGHYCQKPTDLWGCFPWFWSETPDTYIRGKHSHTAFRFGPKNPRLRACIPYGLSLAICKALEGVIKNQTVLNL